jgi:hypothetical protein
MMGRLRCGKEHCKFRGVTFLPIVGRELRVAARKRSTFWLRIAASLAAILIGCLFLLLSTGGLFPLTSLGGVLFGVITWLAMAAAAGAGLFFTSDCLSEEKREGTLGFLFLTDLRGYDVVGGKLLATSLRCFYGLLAVVPMLAVTLLMGGVTGAQFWKTSLALFNALLCSLAAGMFVSALSRDPQKAMAGTFLFLLVWMFGGMLADWIHQLAARRGFPPRWSLCSPFYVFTTAGAWGRAPFWTALGVTQVMAWVLLGLASFVLPRAWQERATRKVAARETWSYAWRYGGAGRRGRLRRRLIERNPVLWLACRERWQALGLWTLAAIAAVTFLIFLAMDASAGAWMAWRSVGWVFSAALYLWMASQAGRFFVEGRRSGLVELLLATPVSVHDIVQGQWRALVRMFGPPIALVVLVDLLAQCLSGGTMSFMVSGSGSGIGASLRFIMSLLSAVAVGVITLANLAAMAWFGMWMGMTSKNNNLATMKTILLVQIIPWMVISFASVLVIPLLLMTQWAQGLLANGGTAAGMSGIMTNWYPLITVGLSLILNVSKDLAFLFWARGRLYASFRDQAVRGLGMGRFATPLPVPLVVAAPPVIGAQK